MNDSMTIIKADHREAKRMLTALGKTEQGAERTKLAAELGQALSLHMTIEEQILHPVVAAEVGAEEEEEADAGGPVPSSPGRRSTTRKTTSKR